MIFFWAREHDELKMGKGYNRGLGVSKNLTALTIVAHAEAQQIMNIRPK